MKINAMQRILLSDYAEGRFSHLLTGEEIPQSKLNELNDPLFLHLLLSLSGEDDRHSCQCACERLLQTQRQILQILRPLMESIMIQVQERRVEEDVS